MELLLTGLSLNDIQTLNESDIEFYFDDPQPCKENITIYFESKSAFDLAVKHLSDS